MKKRICLVGGEDVHKRIALSRYLIAANYDVTILGTSTNEFPDDITYVSYNLVRHFSPLSDRKTIRWYRQFFNENHFDLIHTFDTKPAFLVPWALKGSSTPISRTITGLGTIFMANGPFYAVLRRIYFYIHRRIRSRVYKTIFQNYDDCELYKRHELISDKNYALIFSSGIELKSIHKKAARQNARFTFVFVARLVFEKGVINLLEAARICKTKGHDFRIQLIGPLEENSKRLNRSILEQYADDVEILGQRDDVFELLCNADAFILPTFREGFARVLLEAAAVGLPIVATDVTGVREFVRHEKEGLLVEVRNSEALASAMIRLATDRSLSEHLSDNALKHVEKFSLENVSKQYINIFNKAINQ